VRAALESLAYQSRDLVDAMLKDAGHRLKELRVDGGACKNDFLMQFQADLMDARIDRPRVVETTAMGAAYLAGLQAGVWKSGRDVQRIRKTDRIFKPSMKEGERRRLWAGWKWAVGQVLTRSK
jgi:glycerol kinase